MKKRVCDGYRICEKDEGEKESVGGRHTAIDCQRKRERERHKSEFELS